MLIIDFHSISEITYREIKCVKGECNFKFANHDGCNEPLPPIQTFITFFIVRWDKDQNTSSDGNARKCF